MAVKPGLGYIHKLMCWFVVHRVDVTEGQIAVTFVYLLTALCGTYIWELEVFLETRGTL